MLERLFLPEPNIMLSRKVVNDRRNLSWEEVVALVEKNSSDLDSFTVEGFVKSPFLIRL